MKLFDDLRSEHELIERAVASLRTFVKWRASGSSRASSEDGASFVCFFHEFAGSFHHAREERILVPALVSECALPTERGPIAELYRQHAELETLLERAGKLWVQPQWSPDEASEAVRLTTEHADLLLRHIDMENSVLFPESEQRLARQGVYELEALELPDSARKARAVAEVLIAALPPTENPDLLRGDGCVMCPAMGVTCKGLEREWWTETEWEDFKTARASGD